MKAQKRECNDTQFHEHRLGLAACQVLGLFYLQLLHCPSAWGGRDTSVDNK